MYWNIKKISIPQNFLNVRISIYYLHSIHAYSPILLLSTIQTLLYYLPVYFDS